MTDFQKDFLQRLDSPLAQLLGLQEAAFTSWRLAQSPLQDPFRYRTKYWGWKVASLLIDEAGELNGPMLEGLNRYFEESPFILGPGFESDLLIYGHIQKCLRALKEKKEIWVAIRKFSTPLCHKKAEEIIRETLWPEPIQRVQTVHVRKSAMAAWLTKLRQSTGSCFATAPAILIQQEMPLQFFKDLYDLLSMGQLKRVVAGKEYAVPLSLNTGKADLEKIALLPERSFGIRTALEAVGVPFQEEKIKAYEGKTVELVFHSLLLDAIGLTEEDLKDEENLSRIQMTTLLARQGAVYYQSPSERAKKVADWKKKRGQARAVFQSLTECPLLRAWEYTIASFCDVKTEFARWNLYLGLGIHPDQKNGVGSFLYETMDAELQKCNREIEALSRQYEEELGKIQVIEAMIRQQGSVDRIAQLKSDLMTHDLTLHSVLQRKNELAAKAEQIAQFFTSLLTQYDALLQDSFQELFDPALGVDNASVYEDSLAGFRLSFKHGRRDASTWTAIYSEEQYINCLREFFSNTENEIQYPEEIGKEFVTTTTTALIQFIQKPEFIHAAIQRSQSHGRKSPWDYISGGTLQSLLMAYFNRAFGFKESAIIPKSVEELFDFFMQIQEEGPFLMHSPTHAFIVQMGSLRGEKTEASKWSEEEREYLVHRISERLIESERALFIHLFRQKQTAENNGQFRSQLIEILASRMKDAEAVIDSVLFEQSPLFSQDRAKEYLFTILQKCRAPDLSIDLMGTFFGAIDLFRIAKAMILRSMKSALSDVDWDVKIVEIMQQLGISQSCLLLFGDTNWSGWFFGFVTNPATGKLELWRLNRNATEGFPMTDWKEWMSEKNNSSWVLLADPTEYSL